MINTAFLCSAVTKDHIFSLSRAFKDESSTLNGKCCSIHVWRNSLYLLCVFSHH